MAGFFVAAILIVAILIAWKALSASSRVRIIVEDYEARLKPVDAGTASTTTGKAERERYKDGTEELSVRLYQVDLPNGAKPEVALNGVVLGTIVIQEQRGRFELNTKTGAHVPAVKVGDVVEVRHQGSAILRGTFRED
jgi:hypothetical protein